MDYLVLMQKTWQDEPDYLDAEGIIYHYPQRYFAFIAGFERFVYYRPARGALAKEASSYFGFGTLGQPFPDPRRSDHRFVPVRQYRRLPRLVPHADESGQFFESEYGSRTAFTGRSVRRIAPTDFFRILAAGGVSGDPFLEMADTEKVIAAPYAALPSLIPPTQPLRLIEAIPEGTGYRPGERAVDVFEAAALQERARRDHQRTLQVLQDLVHSRGGATRYNNNIDLLAELRGQRLLIEAKSVGSPSVVVDRMRYGIGQLSDYSIRYRAEIGDAEHVLAFGRIPSADTAWVANILEESKIAFVGLDREPERIVPLNERARSLSLFSAV